MCTINLLNHQLAAACLTDVCGATPPPLPSCLSRHACRYSIGRMSQESAKELRPSDFWPSHGPRAIFFPPQGSAVTPKHEVAPFKWKDFCPAVFRWDENVMK